MVFVRRVDATSCGASLVASTWAVTTAQCVTQLELTQSGCYTRLARQQFTLSLGEFGLLNTNGNIERFVVTISKTNRLANTANPDMYSK